MTAQYRGRLYNMSKDDYLCIDAPQGPEAAAGHAVKGCSLRRGNRQYSFSGQTQRRGR